MSGWAQVGFTVLGAGISGAVGVLLARYQHRLDREELDRDRERDALVELLHAVLPLLVELERPLEARGYWVGGVRELRRLGTWMFDPDENAQRPPDWDVVARRAHEVEQRWWGDLQWRISDPKLRELRERFYDAALHVAIPTSEARLSATELSECVEAIVDRITELIGAEVRIAVDRPQRPSAPDRPNPLRSSPGSGPSANPRKPVLGH